MPPIAMLRWHVIQWKLWKTYVGLLLVIPFSYVPSIGGENQAANNFLCNIVMVAV